MFLRILSIWILLTLSKRAECFPHRTSNNREIQKMEMVPNRIFLEADDDDLDGQLIPSEHDRNSMTNKLNDISSTFPVQKQSSTYHNEVDNENGFGIANKRALKRRKGPTLSVVNPLEILRQRLMLDLARRRIQENQQQIVENADFLENLGKRSSGKNEDRLDERIGIFQR